MYSTIIPYINFKYHSTRRLPYISYSVEYLGRL
jgi:hypothetical protein